MSKKIYIVEDEMILNQQLTRFLEDNGYEAVMFTNGERCLESLNEDSVPDLILMDINLGKNRMDGPSVTKEIYQNYDIPVVLHSAHTDKATLDTTRDMTKYGYIQKVPGNEQFILATVEMAIKLHTAEMELKRRENLYRQLSNHLQKVREEQNAYLAREIHDDLGQLLTALKMNFTLLERTIEEERICSEKIDKTAEDMERIIDGTVRKVRKISTELRPSVVDTEGIMEALEWQVEEFTKNFDIEVVFTSGGEEIRLGEASSLHVFRIVQESLTNSVRHSGAGKIWISVEHYEGLLRVTVKDNGYGFEPGHSEQEMSFGLLGMHERARQCGGELEIKSIKGEGTEVCLRIPVETGEKNG